MKMKKTLSLLISFMIVLCVTIGVGISVYADNNDTNITEEVTEPANPVVPEDTTAPDEITDSEDTTDPEDTTDQDDTTDPADTHYPEEHTDPRNNK